MATKIEKLIQKKKAFAEAIDIKIARLEAVEKRKNEVLDMPEFNQLLSLPISILRENFIKIHKENGTQT